MPRRNGSDVTSSELPTDTAVAVVFFRPSPGQVARIVERFAGRLPVFVYDNGGIPPEALARLREAEGLTRLGEGRNHGIAAALNALAEAATAAGFRRLFLLDQDADATVETAQALGHALDRAIGEDLPPALVGPAPAPKPGHKAPAYPLRPGVPRRENLRPVEFLATSGSLVDLAAFARIGPFREDFFIDAVDLEWCFRAWARGRSCWMDPGTAIPHSVGRGTIRMRFLPVTMPDQPLFRMAVYVRNSAYSWRLPHVPGRWKLKQAAYLPLQIALYWSRHRFSPRVLACLLAALAQGLGGRLGRPADAPP
ncbi:rhamnosyltransferase [Methylorubrum extorquens CM4]|uniref:Rhamnosyltransferase n=1 Tax=Methylorubrum extorquens (strain CM4 / NCIMB 13688) TaxID=440085 RepID=B7KW88_METC4|nr:glycosyltransferase family 2 protein [Methylorubrum extorquens]ACK84445.1 rhamnosyltransferase [Methylorubrum extorquens CM4]